jgi:hypothetical protein
MDGAGVPPQGSDGHSNRPSSFMERVKYWDSQFSVAKGLTIFTLLTGFLGGSFQYLSAYDEKVSAQAKIDMTDATSTFVDISNAFAEAQTLQNLVYFNFADWLGPSDNGEKEMLSKAAHDAFPDYIKARTSLREKSNIFAHKAEIYIDWASDLGRDPAGKHPLNADPVTEALLGDYNFDCDERANFPPFGNVVSKKPADGPAKAKNPTCIASDQKDVTNLCARDKVGNIVSNENKEPALIKWQSAKHHVLIMHYCFEATHNSIRAARVWASNKDLSVTEELKRDFSDQKALTKAKLDDEVTRLNAFMSLAMSQLERIRVKYRPTGYFCHLPLVRNVIETFSERCTPLGTAAGSNS